MIRDESIQLWMGNKNKEKDDGSLDISLIRSPTKYEIIRLLNNNELSFEDIVKNTSKSKPTISMHLKSLREEGIVKYKMDPSDNRKKIFYLCADIIGNVNANRHVHVKENQTKLLIEDFIENGDVEYTLMLVHSFKSILQEFGIEMEYILTSIGNHMGVYLFETLYDKDFNRFQSNIIQYWKDNNLGLLQFELNDNIQIVCYDCFECYNLPKTGKPECYLEVGMFETLFSKYFNHEASVTEIKCYSMGDDYCAFEVEI